ncbi:MAG TPA: hydroxysqualene dehydroxylase HpnE [Azospirillaceae bacterium]|nr:hydroxysqualene dehydroxylase HpnE [Azospirillaceae bacterium]
MSGTVHIVGAGLAGLACATALAAAGRRVALYEAAPQAGGRCRSYHDPVLDRRLDNGNHLVLGGNAEVFRYLDRLGARGGLAAPATAAIPFVDLADGAHWSLAPRGRLPLWLLDRDARVPGAGALAHLAFLRLAAAGSGDTVADRFDTASPLWRRLWRPLAVSVMNTAPEEASARLLWEVMRRTLLAGAEACRPFVADEGLSEAFIDPALAFLERQGATVRTTARLRAVETDGNAVAALAFDGVRVPLGAGDSAVLALPVQAMAELLPGLVRPQPCRAILNLHYRLPAPPALPGSARLLGVVGGTAEWLFLRGDVVSVTVSAADALCERPSDELAALIWQDVRNALALPSGPAPRHRVVKEKRATPAQTPAAVAERPASRTAFANLLLAGDWTDTGLPATIEGAVLSGHRAAALLLGRR